MFHQRYQTIEIYKAEIESLLKTFDIAEDTFRILANKYHRLANQYFNTQHFQEAADYYLQGIQQLENKYKHDVNLNNPQFCDKDFRSLVELYIDLSDALNNLNQHDNACFAFAQAINAFTFISPESKTEYEKTLLDLNDNYVAFRNHIETKTSQPNYLQSNEYKNNGETIKTKYEFDAMNTLLNNVTIEENTNNNELDMLLSNLAVNTIYAPGGATLFAQKNNFKPEPPEASPTFDMSDSL